LKIVSDFDIRISNFQCEALACIVSVALSLFHIVKIQNGCR